MLFDRISIVVPTWYDETKADRKRMVLCALQVPKIFISAGEQ